MQGAVSDAAQSTCGLPPGCGLAVDFLHALLVRTLQSAGDPVEVRKCVDDMVLVAAGPCFEHYLRDSYRDVIQPKQTVVVCNGMPVSCPPRGSRPEISGLILSGLLGRTLCKGKASAPLSSERVSRPPSSSWPTVGGPAADPQASADLSTVRVWHKRILAGRVEWPLEA
eukprot:4676296-Amphidinium_carterae.1